MIKFYKMLCPFLFPIILCCIGCADKSKFIDSLPVINSFDAEKYAGKWYEIARLPHSFEKGLVRVTATYNLYEDGKIDVVNAGYKESVLNSGGSDANALSVAKGQARLKKSNRNGFLEVSFFGPFYADYVVIALDEVNYQYAMVTSSSKKYLWILSRTPELDDKIYSDLLVLASKSGYNINDLIKVNQKK